MRHFVAYHNEARMGCAAADASDPFGVYTSKKVGDPVGDIVWIVTGRGDSPKQYFLSSWFVVSGVTPADRAEFGSMLIGKQGGVFDPMPQLDGLDWFAEFRRRVANFSFGLTELRDPETVNQLCRLAADAGHRGCEG